MPQWSLRCFNPVLEGSRRLFAELTGPAQGWRRNIRINGGYWMGSFKLRAHPDILYDFFANRLGYHIEEEYGGIKTWEGLIYDMELQTGGIIRRRSLDDIRNSVRVVYNDQNDEAQISSYASDTQSIARYGTKQITLAYDGAQQSTAEKLRDTYLKENAWPWPRPVTTRSRTGRPVLNVKVCGYVFTANWRYVSSVAELDQEQGALTYLAGPARFQDDGQDFSAWASAAANASYSLFITNNDGTITSGWLGAASTVTNPNDTIAVYTDQALTTPGWNDTNPAGKTPESYYVYGPSSEWISSIVSTDLEFITSAAIRENKLQVKRGLYINDRCWDVISELTEFGSDSDDKPWRFAVSNDRLATYEEIDTTPKYYMRNSKIFTDVAAQRRANPWLAQPGVYRDLDYPLSATGASNPWLSDGRDVFIEEIEASERGIKTKLVGDFGESELASEVR